MTRHGGVFFRESAGVDARKLVAKLCDEGMVISADARAATGTDVVGFAVHPPRDGFWAIADSADGALGIGDGAWSQVALAANHLGTDAFWYRAYTPELALGVAFPHGGTWLRAYAGTAADIVARLEGDGVPVSRAVPPRDAGEDALLAAVAYEPGKYRTGPDAELARQLHAVHEALVAGDGTQLRARVDALPESALPFALGIVRGADRGAWQACIQACARAILVEPPRMRTRLAQMTLDEEVLRRAAELAHGDAAFVPFVDRLDAIEAEAKSRSSHAHPAGVAQLAVELQQRGAMAAAFACWLRLVRRPKPAWYDCNAVLVTLLGRAPALELDAEAREAIAAVERRLPDLGQSAVDAITYNLACVHARAGDAERALVALRRCREPMKQNPHPEQDTDLQALWQHPEFRALLGGPARALDTPIDELELEPPYEVPAEHAVPRLRIAFAPRPGAEGALIDRLGGKPNAPTADFAWPSSPSRPMRLIAQLVGTAAGGAIALGDIHVLQIFADLDGDYYEPDHQAIVAHRSPCPAVVEPPATVEVAEVRAMTLEAGADDRRLLDEDRDELDGFDAGAAHTHAWCDKIGGVPVGANVDTVPRDREGEPMKLVLELVTFDDWFLWALFATEDFRELQLQVERG